MSSGPSRSRSGRRVLQWLLLVAGTALFVALLARVGAAPVVDAFGVLGWGLAAALAFHIVPLILNGLGWRALVPGLERASLRRLVLYSWINESLNNLLPVARVGGELVRARLLARALGDRALGAASVVVDFTLGLFAQLGFVSLALLAAFGANLRGAQVLAPVLAAAVLFTVFLVLQRRGVFGRTAGLLVRFLPAERTVALVAEGSRLDRQVAALYAERRLVGRCFVLRLMAWVCGAGETWLVLHYLGQASLGGALALEGLGYAARGIAFMMPAALGVQEALHMLAAAAVGLGPETGLVVSLVKRVRELVFGGPGLAAWPFAERSLSRHGLTER